MALGVELEQLLRHVAHAGPDFGLGLVPRRAAELVEARCDAFDATVLLDEVEPGEGDEQALAAGVEDLHDLVVGSRRSGELAHRGRQRRGSGSPPAPVPPARRATRSTDAQSHELADAVIVVDDVVADLEVAQSREKRSEAATATALAARHRPGQELSLAVNRDSGHRQPVAAFDLAGDDLDAAPPEDDVACLEELRQGGVAFSCGATRRRRSPRDRVAATSLGKRGNWPWKRSVVRTPKSSASPGAASGTTAAEASAMSASTASTGCSSSAGSKREPPVLATRGELLREALAMMGDFGSERSWIEGHPEGVGQEIGERQGARSEQRQEVLPARELPAVGERGKMIPGLAPGLLSRDVGERLRQPPGGIGLPPERAPAAAGPRPPGVPCERWDSTSKRRRLSISLPKRSSRRGPRRQRRTGRRLHRAPRNRPLRRPGRPGDSRAPQAERKLIEVDLGAAPQLDRRQASGLRQSPEKSPRRDEQRPEAPGEGIRERRDLLRSHRERGLGLLIGRERGGCEVPADALSRHQPQTLEPGIRIGFVRHDDDERFAHALRQEVEDPGCGRRR